MAGITQNSCVALFPLRSLKRNFVRADVNQQKHTKKIQSSNLLRNHVSIMTAPTVIIISLITNIKIAVILIANTKNNFHNNNNNKNNNKSSNSNNNNNNNSDNNKSTNNNNNNNNDNNNNDNNNNNNNNSNSNSNNRSLFEIN